MQQIPIQQFFTEIKRDIGKNLDFSYPILHKNLLEIAEKRLPIFLNRFTAQVIT